MIKGTHDRSVQIFQLDTFKRSWQCFLVFVCFFFHLFPKHVRIEAHWLKPKILTILKHSKNSQVLKWQKERCSPKTTRTANIPSLTEVCKQSCWTYCTRLLWDWPAVQQAVAATSWCLCVPQPCFPDLCLEQSFDIHPLMLEVKEHITQSKHQKGFQNL